MGNGYTFTMEYCNSVIRTINTYNMGESQMQMRMEKKTLKMLHIVSFHFYDILEKAKLLDRKQFRSCQRLETEGVDYKEA